FGFSSCFSLVFFSTSSTFFVVSSFKEIVEDSFSCSSFTQEVVSELFFCSSFGQVVESLFFTVSALQEPDAPFFSSSIMHLFESLFSSGLFVQSSVFCSGSTLVVCFLLFLCFLAAFLVFPSFRQLAEE
ncbi:hypothetical protein XELAEV_18003370mg, partial [Xenopus laevis]